MAVLHCSVHSSLLGLRSHIVEKHATWRRTGTKLVFARSALEAAFPTCLSNRSAPRPSTLHQQCRMLPIPDTCISSEFDTNDIKYNFTRAFYQKHQQRTRLSWSHAPSATRVEFNHQLGTLPPGYCARGQLVPVSQAAPARKMRKLLPVSHQGNEATSDWRSQQARAEAVERRRSVPDPMHVFHARAF